MIIIIFYPESVSSHVGDVSRAGQVDLRSLCPIKLSFDQPGVSVENCPLITDGGI